ncbi:rhodanese-like domain-containing protein [Endozoicomonas lisbonensis]|uniref:rhodanese-like domain-containing protein n=1 Tax=Endozoicomonas lisbonensis TaxID=3120522 RepID=UPI003396F7C3
MFITCAALLLLAGLSGCERSDRYKLEAALESASVTLARQAELSGYGLITSQELAALLKRDPAVVLVDTRRTSDYNKGHIRSAKNFTFPKGVLMENVWDDSLMMGRTKQEFLQLLGADRNRLLVFSCGRTRCERGHNGALWAVRLGYRRVLRHPGGVEAWLGEGFELVR